jgi:hypothetical protein
MYHSGGEKMSSRKKAMFSIIWMTVVIGFGMAMLFAAVSHAAHPFQVTLKGYDGSTITQGSTQPYSPKLSCGVSGCHDYAVITQGYHFQQGRTDAAGAIAVSDTFDAAKPWVLSAGMFGKW